MNLFLEILSWCFVLVAIFASIDLTRRHPNLFRVNLLYLISDLFNVVYFFFETRYQFVLLQIVFSIIAIIGVRNNRKIKVPHYIDIRFQGTM